MKRQVAQTHFRTRPFASFQDWRSGFRGNAARSFGFGATRLPKRMALRTLRYFPTFPLAIAACLLPLLCRQQAVAGSPGASAYHLLNPQTSPGTVGEWSATADPYGATEAAYFQPFRIVLPEQGRITLCTGSSQDKITVDSPAQVGLLVGRTYWFQISHMPEFPGLELFPSVEVLDRLHPPSGLAEKFPVPIEFTQDEIDLALQGSLVTRVIYLEQPQLAAPMSSSPGQALPARTVPAHVNLLAEADRLGRPMAIVRLGGRIPIAGEDNFSSFGLPAPISNPRSLGASTESTNQDGLKSK